MAIQVKTEVDSTLLIHGTSKSDQVIRRQPAHSIRARGSMPHYEAECMAAIFYLQDRTEKALGITGASMYVDRTRLTTLFSPTPLPASALTCIRMCCSYATAFERWNQTEGARKHGDAKREWSRPRSVARIWTSRTGITRSSSTILAPSPKPTRR